MHINRLGRILTTLVVLPVWASLSTATADSLYAAETAGVADANPSTDVVESTVEVEQRRDVAKTAVVSDLTSEEVAREILELQKQLGGSVVDQMQAPRWIAAEGEKSGEKPVDGGPPVARHRHVAVETPDQANQLRRVSVLREVAFSLDGKAHHLENLDLYEPADALRQVAARLRHEARRIKQHVAEQHRARAVMSAWPNPAAQKADGETSSR